MSIETSDEIDSLSPNPGEIPSTSMPATEWKSLRRQMLKRAKAQNARSILGKASKRGGAYRWGVAAARGEACDELTDLLSRIACDRAEKVDVSGIDLAASADTFLIQIDGVSNPTPLDCLQSLLWAAALPALSGCLDQPQWWRLLATLERLRESILERSAPHGPAHLMLAGELGLTLAWRLADLPSCRQGQLSSFAAVAAWCDHPEESIASATARGINARLILASLERCRRILKKTSKHRLSTHQLETAQTLATWVAAMTYHSGGTAFSEARRDDLIDDLAPGGLLARAVKFDPEALGPAISTALGAAQTGGRLVWEVDLPESLHHQPNSKIAVFFPDWDVRRGRVHVDYSRKDVRTEVFAGRAQVIAGDWQTMIQVDGEEQQASDDWSEVCEFSDDDVHYLEIEQPWTGGVTLQRQFLLIRDDRCLLLADAVLPTSNFHEASQSIRYSSRIPLCDSIRVEPESETREMFLSEGHRRRGLVVPLSASEWQMGPTDASAKETADGYLLSSSEGVGRLYVPLWFDFQQRRFDRLRTWRQLTVADRLRINNRDEAVGYRIQVGSEQWMVYSSLAESRCRTVLGKHLDSGFFASRFDPGDGSHDALVTVDDNEQHDD
jgi:hypothetical protein